VLPEPLEPLLMPLEPEELVEPPMVPAEESLGPEVDIVPGREVAIVPG
jgi:hypothetical protein